jgi:hypothetical protein
MKVLRMAEPSCQGPHVFKREADGVVRCEFCGYEYFPKETALSHNADRAKGEGNG